MKYVVASLTCDQALFLFFRAKADCGTKLQKQRLIAGQCFLDDLSVHVHLPRPPLSRCGPVEDQTSSTRRNIGHQIDLHF